MSSLSSAGGRRSVRERWDGLSVKTDLVSAARGPVPVLRALIVVNVPELTRPLGTTLNTALRVCPEERFQLVLGAAGLG